MRPYIVAIFIAVFAIWAGAGGVVADDGGVIDDTNSTAPIGDCTVIDSSGDYELNTDIGGGNGACFVIVDSRNVTLDGNNHTIFSSSIGVEIRDSSNVTVENLTVRDVADSGIIVGDSVDVIVRNITVRATGEEGLISRNSEQVRFSNNVVEDTGGFGGIAAEGSTFVEIVGNDVEQIDAVGLRSAGSSHVRVANNTVINVGENPDEHAPYNGMQMFESSNVTIENNFFDGHIYGIQISEQSSNIFVIENVIRNTTLCAADVKGSQDILFDGNTLINHAGLDIERNASNVTIRHNIVRDSRTFGIAVKRDSSNVLVYNNSVFNTTLSGIWMHPNHNRPGAYPRNVTLRNNTIRENGNWGIRLDGVANILVTNNSIERNGNDGSRILESHQVIFRNNLVRENGINISDEFVSAGIRVAENSQNITIHRNHLEDNGHGVLAEESTSDINATQNWWGSESGPGGVGPGDGDAVSEHVAYEPWLRSAPIGDIPTVGVSDDGRETEPTATRNGDVAPTEASQPGFDFIVGVIGILITLLLGFRNLE